MANILVVDSNSVLAQTYAQALRHFGHEVVVARGAQEAIACADKHKLGVVVLELQLVGPGGVAFLHEFRSYADWRDIPAIVNTSLPPGKLPAARPALARLGVTTILYKPRTTLADIAQAVQQYCPEKSL